MGIKDNNSDKGTKENDETANDDQNSKTNDQIAISATLAISTILKLLIVSFNLLIWHFNSIISRKSFLSGIGRHFDFFFQFDTGFSGISMNFSEIGFVTLLLDIWNYNICCVFTKKNVLVKFFFANIRFRKLKTFFYDITKKICQRLGTWKWIDLTFIVFDFFLNYTI